MKPNKLSILAVFPLLAYSADTLVLEFVKSYDMETMYEMASEYVQLVNGDVDAALYGAEFRGYIAAVLDSEAHKNEEFAECTKRQRVRDTAMRAALLITSTPLDRSQNYILNIWLAVSMACDEEGWKAEN